MALHNAQSEPSMEEILASIRRIISEDEPKLEDEAFDAPAPAAAMDAIPEEPDDALDDLVVFDEPPPEPPMPKPAPAKPAPAPMAMEDEAILSEPARAATADAFMRLSGALRIADHPGQTLEGVVRELLKPMLKDWLDTHLAGIVEARVEAELNRISRLSA